MKNLAIALALASSLALAGCATLNQPAPSTSTSGPLATDPQITAIQQQAVKICRYLPAVETVAAIVATFTGGGPVVALGSNVARSICNAVTTNPLADGPGPRNYQPTVNGVRVQGKFL